MASSREHATPRATHSLLRRHRLTAEQYLRMGELGILPPDARVELIEGEVIDMAPTGSRHAGIVRHIAHLFERAVGDAAIVSSQNPIALGSSSQPEPDIALLRPRSDFYKSRHPVAADTLLVVEVADTSLQYDRRIKVPLYARHGITEVWIVEIERDRVRAYREPTTTGYRIAQELSRRATVAPQALQQCAIDLDAVLAR